MSSRRRKKKKSPQATVTPIKQVNEPKPEKAAEKEHQKHDDRFMYGQILPHEIFTLKPLMSDFYRAIGMGKELEDTMPAVIQSIKDRASDPDDVFMPLINEAYNEIKQNPYSIIYACVDNSLNFQGYMWFRVDINPYGISYITVEHDYVIPEHRGKLTEARIHDRFIAYVVEIAERCNVQYVNTLVRSKSLSDSRKKLGFVPVEQKMRFTGNAEDFKNRNLRFWKYSRYNRDIEEKVNGRIEATNKT